MPHSWQKAIELMAVLRGGVEDVPAPWPRPLPLLSEDGESMVKVWVAWIGMRVVLFSNSYLECG